MARRLMLKDAMRFQVDRVLEGLQAVRAVLAERLLGDAAAGGGQHHVQAAELAC